MRIRDAIVVSATTATFMLILQPERRWIPPVDATHIVDDNVVEKHTSDVRLPLTLGMHTWQDGARDRDQPQRGDGRRGDGRRNGRRGGDRNQFSGDAGFPPFEPVPDPEIFSAELIAHCIEVAREINPELGDRLREMCDTDPEEFEMVMRTRARKILGLAMLKARSPELYGLRMQDMQYEQQADEYAREMRQAIEAGEELRARDLERRLRNTLEVKFALSLSARHDYIKLMEQHVESMWQSFKEDAGSYQATIDGQIERFKEPRRRRWDRNRDLENIELPSSGDGV